MNEKIMGYVDCLNDLTKNKNCRFSDILKVLKKSFNDYKENRLSEDEFVTAYGCICNAIIKAGIIKRDNYFLMKTQEILADDNILNVLECIFEGITTRNEQKFVEISDKYALPNIYLLVFNVAQAFTNNDKKSQEIVIAAYKKLLESNWLDYVFQKQVLNENNPIVNQYLIPFISNYTYRDILAKSIEVEYKYFKGKVQPVSELDLLRKLEINSTKDVDLNISIQSFFGKVDTLSQTDNDGGLDTSIDKIYNEAPLYRAFAARIPFYTGIRADVIKLTIENFIKNAELEKANQKNEALIKQRQALLNEHAHNWKHIIFPETVKNVADELYCNDNVELANKLFYAYNSQTLLQSDLKLLEIKYTSSDEEFRDNFMSGLCSKGNTQAKNIYQIFNKALEIVLFRLIMDGVHNKTDDQKIKISLFSIANKKLLQEKYVKDFIINKEQATVPSEWFSKNIYSLNIKGTESWDGIFMNSEKLAYPQMIEIFIDLIYNAINYGVKNDKGYISLEFSIESIDNVKYYVFAMSNPIDRNSAIFDCSGQGLKSIASTIDKLNDNSHGVDTIEENDVYKIKIRIKEEVLY